MKDVFAEFQAFVGKALRVPGTWFQGDFGRQHERDNFEGKVIKAVKGNRSKSQRLHIKFNGDRTTFEVYDLSTVRPYVIDE